ncbi:MAG: hypothetical protein EA341_01465 [Mongoliibacter sp.]|jgi:hypothetical protein|uniref:hypothetical protein n=1 Tax=Mongoliibacter sp. TaxID=2022438 RepID=UPI0012F08305|nr:hypothetical protein [Mongoliibacter sp.]TVP53167.1 MAG: hypothetical protein EA341_01465 [Mongoliibacter sp.]
MLKTKVLILSVFAFTFCSITSIQAKEDGKPLVNPTMTEAEVQVLVDRLEEIKTMDLTTMERSEKKELRSEVREINKEIKRAGGGVYLSVGAIIIVIILLILLL